MPKLPEQKARDFEILDKSTFSRGTLDKFKPPAIKHHLKLPIKPIIGVLILVLVLGGIYIISKTYFPDLIKQKAPAQAEKSPEFEYPLNVNDVKFPSEFLKEKFLANFQKASVEKDADTRYKLLEEDFMFLNGFYASTASYDFRVQLEKYRDYIKKNYPGQYEKNKGFYDFACIDKLCAGASEAKYPPEIIEIQNALAKNTSISPVIRDSLVRNLDTAVFSKDKNNQGNSYISVLTSLSLEYKTSKDEAVKDLYLKLNDYVGRNYPEFKVPESVKVES